MSVNQAHESLLREYRDVIERDRKTHEGGRFVRLVKAIGRRAVDLFVDRPQSDRFGRQEEFSNAQDYQQGKPIPVERLYFKPDAPMVKPTAEPAEQSVAVEVIEVANEPEASVEALADETVTSAHDITDYLPPVSPRQEVPAEYILPPVSSQKSVETRPERRTSRWRRKLGAVALAAVSFAGVNGLSSQAVDYTGAPQVATATIDALPHTQAPMVNHAVVEAAPLATIDLPAVIEASSLVAPKLFSEQGGMTNDGVTALKADFHGYTIKSGDSQWSLGQKFLEARGETVTRAKVAAVVRAWQANDLTPSNDKSWLNAGDTIA